MGPHPPYACETEGCDDERQKGAKRPGQSSQRFLSAVLAFGITHRSALGSPRGEKVRKGVNPRRSEVRARRSGTGATRSPKVPPVKVRSSPSSQPPDADTVSGAEARIFLAAAGVAASVYVAYREGFRMAAGRERSTRYRAAIRKPPKKEPAGSGEQLAVYGDLMGQQRLPRGMSLPMSLRAEWRR
jgi:hypothetical protein